MSAFASTRARARSATLSDRLVAAVPLASIYLWLSAVYMVESWRRVTPWLFGDELEFTQLARSIAETGHPAERGYPHGADSVWNYVTAPLWLIHDVSTAYSSIKYLDVLVMAAVVFPAYFLARMVVGKTAALFAAAGAGTIPSLAYSSYLVQEPIAYPYAALCFLLIAKALLVRSRGWIAGAIVASAFAPAVKGELVVVPAVLVLATVFAVWSSDPGKRWRARWSTGDWVGALVLVLGAIFLISAIGTHHSTEWMTVTRGYKHRIINQGNWAAGTLALGMGILPFVAGLAALFPARGEPASREVRMFRCVSAGGLIAFGLYTGMKAAWLSTQFATRVEERNLIYIAPLLFVGAALVFSRRAASVIGLVVAGAYTLYLESYALYHVTQYPYQMGVQLYSDALGFAIVQQANRYLGWTPHFVRILLVVMFVVAILVLVAPRLLRGRARIAAAITAVAAVGVIGWNLTGEIAAAAGTNSIAHAAGATLGRPFTWLDQATHGKPTLYMGEAEVDQNPEWLLEFWNRSIKRVSSLDGSVLGPGFSGSPNILRNGALYWQDLPEGLKLQYDYGVEDLPCVDLAGKRVASHLHRAGGRLQTWALVKLARPNRLQSTCTGIYADGWTGEKNSVYYRFSGPTGWVKVVYSRRDWGFKSGPTPVRITVGTMRIEDLQPALARVTRTLDTSIDSTQTKVAWLRVPAGGFAVHVVVAKKVVPQQYDPSSGDRRELGVELSYRYFRTRPHR